VICPDGGLFSESTISIITIECTGTGNQTEAHIQKYDVPAYIYTVVATHINEIITTLGRTILETIQRGGIKKILNQFVMGNHEFMSIIISNSYIEVELFHKIFKDASYNSTNGI
jgi:hypothetical protein